MKAAISGFVIFTGIMAFWWRDIETESRKSLPRLPGATLLMDGDVPYTRVVTTPTGTWVVQRKDEYSGDTPSISRDGRLIAAVRSRSKQRGVIAVYSILDKKWTDYRDIEGGTPVAISPDGLKLAYMLREDRDGYRAHPHFIDLKTGADSVGPLIGHSALYGWVLSWSPSDSQIAYDEDQASRTEGKYRPIIEVLDVQNGTIRKIADGTSPAWSPSGEWIAYFNASKNPNELAIVRPDGTGAKVLLRLPDERVFVGAPVWSPDSTQLLLNELHNVEKSTVDIQLLDLRTLRMERKFKDVPAIYGWAETK